MKRVRCITCGASWAVNGKLQCANCSGGKKSHLRAMPAIDPLKTIEEFTGSKDPSLVGGMEESPVTCIVRHNATGEIVMLHEFLLVGFQGNEELTVINTNIIQMHQALQTLQKAYQEMLAQASPEVRREMTKDLTKEQDMTTTIEQDLSGWKED